jgi:hypothetical protein
MTTAPFVELGFNPTDLRPRDLPSTGAFLGSPADAIEAALAVTRAAMVDEMKNQVRGIAEPTHAQLLRLADLAWQAVFWKYRKISAPVMADAYVQAYRDAEAGDVPMSVIYDLADKHAEKIGDYFHTSSREALAEGFTTLVNRRMPAKAAADRVLDAYGLTRRQMRGYVSGQQQFSTPISSVLPQSVKAKARTYIDRAFTTRTRKMSRQEEHNIDEQAKQFAWMWLQDKGRLSEKAQKIWITAHDERVCPVCGHLHGQKVGVNEQFRTKEGSFWTPGLHPNCRCVVRLIENRFAKRLKGIFAKADFDPRLHPRGGDTENKGRFSRVSTRPAEPVIDLPESDILETLSEPEVEEKPIRLREDTEPIRLGDQIRRLGDKPISLSGKPIRLQEKTPTRLKAEESTRLGDSVRMSPEEIGHLIRLAPVERMKLASSVEQFLLRDAQAPVLARRPSVRNKVYDRPTMYVHDVTGKPHPYYAVVEDDVPYDGHRYNLHHDIFFTPNFQDLSNRLVELRDEKIQTAVGDIAIDLEETPIVRRSGDRMYTARLEEEEIAGPIHWVANGAQPGEDKTVQVMWVGPSGDEMEDWHKYSDIIDMLRFEGHTIRPQDFDVKVMRLDEAHSSDPEKGERGYTTKHNTAGAFQGEESWVTEGDYTVKRRKVETIHSEPGNKINAVVEYLDPEVEETEIDAPTILGGEWPPYGN